VGGHCISVDPWFLVHTAPDLTPLIRTAREVNNRKPHFVLKQIERAARQCGAKTIGCLGLAYKADVDDLRESPSLEIVLELRQQGRYEVLACEPYVSAETFSEFPLVPLEDVLQRSDLLVLLTDHTQFRDLTPQQLKGKTLVDTRGTWRQILREPAAAQLVAVQPKRRAA
jgi:UDP-N-acetyl-D-mannosaminuronic acid dehydrogenase